MPIPVPNLDDRSYEDLVREALSRIPAHTPEWTNPAPGDPGRTLVELFAWLTDTLLYRVNLIPEKQRLAFLNLLGERVRPAVAARTVVALSANPPDVAAIPIPALSPLAGAQPFETRGPVMVLPVNGECYVKRKPTQAENRFTQPKLASLATFYRQDGKLTPYFTTGVFVQGNPAPFDVAADTLDGCLYFALLVPKDKEVEKAKIVKAIATGDGGPVYLNIGVIPMIDAPPFGEEHLVRQPLAASWELSTRDRETGEIVWRVLDVDDDSTLGLTTDGIVRLVMPEAGALFAPPNNVRASNKAGVGASSPPRVDDPEKDRLLLGWVRMRPKARPASLKVAWSGINAVALDARRTTRLVVAGTGNGQPDQRVKLPVPSGAVESPSLELEVEEEGRGFTLWKRVDDIILAGLNERHYVLDADEGVVSFGDGVRGRIPAEGARIRVRMMRTGGGAKGNVPAGALTAMSAGAKTLKVQQPFAARGGADGETLEAALRRIPQTIRSRDRAVTAEDYRHLTMGVPGVQVGRVEVMPGFRPQTRDTEMPGIVSVMALPDRADFHAPYPRVDRPFIETITKYLDARRPVGTELYVIGCEYVPIAISIGVDHAPNDGERIHAAVQAALQKHLFSLRPGGPTGAGWPLGATVRRRELEIVVSRVDGVMGVDGPVIFTPHRRTGRAEEWKPFNQKGASGDIELPLRPWQLPELLAVVVGTGTAPSSVLPPAPVIEGGTSVGVPVVPEVC